MEARLKQLLLPFTRLVAVISWLFLRVALSSNKQRALPDSLLANRQQSIVISQYNIQYELCNICVRLRTQTSPYIRLVTYVNELCGDIRGF